MSRFYWLLENESEMSAYRGSFDASHKWYLPGVRCPGCNTTWASSGHQYPCIDLSLLPEVGEFEEPRPEPFSEFARLRELVRPLAPPDAWLPPGTSFGPLVGRASGSFGPFAWDGSWLMLMRRESLEDLQAEGVKGLRGCRTELHFRQKNPPEMLELQIEPHGRLHPDCIPPEVPPPCATCGRFALSRPDEPILDAASLPTDRDLFRVGNFATMVIGTERFMDAVLRLDLDGITYRELPTR